MRKPSMGINQLIDELIELCNTKYGLIQIGQDTLHTDVLFITKFEALKTMMEVDTLNEIDLREFPKIKDLQAAVKKINTLENNKENRNLRMKKATNAYKK